MLTANTLTLSCKLHPVYYFKTVYYNFNYIDFPSTNFSCNLFTGLKPHLKEHYPFDFYFMEAPYCLPISFF